MSAPGARSVALRGAGQILRPPRVGLPWLRGADLAAQTLTGGDLGWSDGVLSERPLRSADLELDVSGCAVVPGFVDCHTHLPFAGWRAGEYAQKVAGVPYSEIASGGGGIRASARALGAASDEQVLAQARGMAFEMLAAGTTTFEMKSGYGLSREGEIRALRLAAAFALSVPQTTLSTALLAHAVPDGYDAAGWMHEVGEMMGEVLDLGSVSALDIFVETIAFSVSDLAAMGALARAGGLMLRTHVEQFERLGSVPVALTAGARSVDHLSVASDDDVALLADAACAAVLLPAAEFLGAEHRAPGRVLADAGALVVLATDANPGTAPVVSMPVVIGLAARLYGWSPMETLAACTLNAAWTLGLEATLGSIEAGKRADVLVLDSPVESIAYRFGRNPVAVAFVGGDPVYVRDDWADRVRVRS
ncbi:MAG: imidazolonepropionase [Solirubrobacteraceae bacterium]